MLRFDLFRRPILLAFHFRFISVSLGFIVLPSQSSCRLNHLAGSIVLPSQSSCRLNCHVRLPGSKE
jgi:hypothetical protein